MTHDRKRWVRDRTVTRAEQRVAQRRSKEFLAKMNVVIEANKDVLSTTAGVLGQLTNIATQFWTEDELRDDPELNAVLYRYLTQINGARGTLSALLVAPTLTTPSSFGNIDPTSKGFDA